MSSGWKNRNQTMNKAEYESWRHGLSAKGIPNRHLGMGKLQRVSTNGTTPNFDKLAGLMKGRKIPITSIKSSTTTRYTSPEGFEFTFEPVEGSIVVETTKKGFTAKYLTPESDPESPEGYYDDSLFLVHYHNQFDVRKKEIITEDELRDLYQGKKIPQQKDYWIFPVDAYIHGGVSLQLSGGFRGQLPEGHERFDVSSTGAILVSKKEFKTRKTAEKSASGLIDSWNKYLSGDVYGVVKETYDKNKEQITHDSVWGYGGFKYAMESLKDEI